MRKLAFRSKPSPAPAYPRLGELDRRQFLAGLGLTLLGGALATSCQSAMAESGSQPVMKKGDPEVPADHPAAAAPDAGAAAKPKPSPAPTRK
jgi:hypothetical protein